MELSRGVLVTGADGQLGAALCEEFADVPLVALTRAEWDVTLPPPPTCRTSTSSFTPRPGRTWTEPKTLLRTPRS